jgi:hypothetical protein
MADAPAAPSQPPPPARPPAPVRKPLPWRVPRPKPDVAATPSCNPNYRPPAPGA